MEENKNMEQNQNENGEQKNDAGQIPNQPKEKVGIFKRIGHGIKTGAGKGKDFLVKHRGTFALAAGTAIGVVGTIAYVGAKVANAANGGSETEPSQEPEIIDEPDAAEEETFAE